MSTIPVWVVFNGKDKPMLDTARHGKRLAIRAQLNKMVMGVRWIDLERNHGFSVRQLWLVEVNVTSTAAKEGVK